MKSTKIITLLLALSIGSFAISWFSFKNSNVEKAQIAKAFQIHIDSTNDLEEVKENLELAADQIQSIDVNSVNTNVTVYHDSGKDVRLSFKAKSNQKNEKVFQYKLENQHLEIKLDDGSLRKAIYLQWDDENIRGGEAGPELKIYLPKSLKRLAINNVNGDIKIKKIDVSEVDINQVSGDINLEEVKAEEIETVQVSGRNKISKVLATSLNMTSVSGDVKVLVNDESDYSIQLDTTSGTIKNELKSVLKTKGKMKITTVSGDIRIKR